MGDQVPIPLTSNTAEGDISGHETLINVYPRKATGGKYPFNLISSPGLALFLELPTLPVLAMHHIGDKYFAVTPTKFYEIFNDGSYTELGDVVLSGHVVMDDNGQQLVVVDGSKGFYYDIDLGVVGELSGPGWYPARTVTEQDGFFIFERSGTDQFFISKLLSIEFDPLDFSQAGGSTDNLVAVLSDHREVFLFGTDTIRVQYNSGAGDFPFELNQGAFIEKGCAAPYSVAKQNNTVYFVGSDLMVYELAGYVPRRISTHAVEQSLEGADLSNAYAYTYHDDGHLFYVLTIPGITWCYDISTQSWNIKKDYHFGRHRALAKMFMDKKTLVSDFQNGRIYQMTRAMREDDGEPLVVQFVLPTVNKGRDLFAISSLEIDMSAGVGLTDGQGKNPIATLEISHDGETWGIVRFAEIGQIGKYLTRVKWNRLGTARQFIFRITISDPVEIDIGGAWIEYA